MNLKTMKRLTTLVGILLIPGLLAPIVTAADLDLSKLPPAADKKGVTYAKDIKPLVEAACIKCHGPEKQKGKVRLDSLEAALKSGEKDKAIVPGQSAKSPLVHAVAQLDPDMAMPPEGKGDPLTKVQVGLIRAWIDQGAK
jgi:mono/diheme cytochrome c family protein